MVSSSSLLRGLSALMLVALAACNTTGTGPSRLAEAPMCTIHAVSFAINPVVDTALVSERTDPAATFNQNHGFPRFRQIGAPRGNTTVGFTPDVFGISEAWSRNAAGARVFRAQSHPARRGSTGPFDVGAWSFSVQDAAGSWTGPSRAFTAQRGSEQDSPAAGALMTPQLMPVGVATPQVFGCAGERSDDDVVRTTWLVELLAPDPRSGAALGVDFIQDLLSGDDRFVPNAPGPLIGPARPPTPRITGRPGHPVREGSVKCAMTQLEDDVSMRELHMLTLHDRKLYHSMASNFSAALTDGGSGSGSGFNRFNAVSPWGDVEGVLGADFGNIIDASIVAWPRAVHVFFVAESGGRYRLWHTVRFSAAGNWRPAVDMFAVMQLPHGRGEPFRVAAGNCPMPDDPSKSELVYTFWRTDEEIKLGRIISTPRLWFPGYESIYSPLADLSHLIGRTSDTSRQSHIHSMTIGPRPFRDTDRVR